MLLFKLHPLRAFCFVLINWNKTMQQNTLKTDDSIRPNAAADPQVIGAQLYFKPAPSSLYCHCKSMCRVHHESCLTLIRWFCRVPLQPDAVVSSVVVLGLGLEGQVLGLGLEGQVLVNNTGSFRLRKAEFDAVRWWVAAHGQGSQSWSVVRFLGCN